VKTAIAVVVPVCRMDWHLAIKMLRHLGRTMWYSQVDIDYPLIVLHSSDLTPAQVWRLNDASRWHPNRHMRDAAVAEKGYFGGTPSSMWKAGAEYVEQFFPGHAFLYLEADCAVIGGCWMDELRKEYDACGKPFLGDLVIEGQTTPHMTGVAVYPPNWRTLAPSLAALPGPNVQIGWDSQSAHETFPQAAQSKAIRQVWRPEPFTCTNLRRVLPHDCWVFHQCKDGTIFDALDEERTNKPIPLDAPIGEATYEAEKAALFGAQVLAPRQLRIGILCVTFRRDVEFLRYSLQGVRKYAKGFTGVTVMVPDVDREIFAWVEGDGATLKTFHEAPGKGMLAHEIQVCRADEIMPTCDAVMHLDADFMPWRNFTPEDVAPGGRPLLVRELYSVCGVRNPNRMIWKGTVTAACGLVPEWETMVRHPQVHMANTYKRTRELVEKHTKMPFDDYVLSCRNEFPQGFAEFPTLGAVAIRHFSGEYTMLDYDHDADGVRHGLPKEASYQYIYDRRRDIGVEFWSRAGIKAYEADARNFLNGQLPAYYVK
jgi:hypothetical protein